MLDTKKDLDILIAELQRRADKRRELRERYQRARQLEQEGKRAEATREMLGALEEARKSQLELFDGVPIASLLGVVEAVSEVACWEEEARDLAGRLPTIESELQTKLGEIEETLANYEKLRGLLERTPIEGRPSWLQEAEEWGQRMQGLLRDLQRELQSLQSQEREASSLLRRVTVLNCLLQFEALLNSERLFLDILDQAAELLRTAREELSGIPETEELDLRGRIRSSEREVRLLRDLRAGEKWARVEQWQSKLVTGEPLDAEEKRDLNALAQQTGSRFLICLWAQSAGVTIAEVAERRSTDLDQTVQQWWREWAALVRVTDWSAKKNRLKAIQGAVQGWPVLDTGAECIETIRAWRARLDSALEIGRKFSQLDETGGNRPEDPGAIRAVLDWLQGRVDDTPDEVFILFFQDWQRFFNFFRDKYRNMTSRGRRQGSGWGTLSDPDWDRYLQAARRKYERGQSMLAQLAPSEPRKGPAVPPGQLKTPGITPGQQPSLTELDRQGQAFSDKQPPPSGPLPPLRDDGPLAGFSDWSEHGQGDEDTTTGRLT